MATDTSMQFDSETGEVTQWLQNWTEDHDAFGSLWKHFFPKLAGIADRDMKSLPSKARDGEDVALSAMKDLFFACVDGRYDIKSRDELWRLLLKITYRKVLQERRRQTAQKRGGGIAHIGNEKIGEMEVDAISMLADKNQMPELVEDVYKECRELLNSLPGEMLRVTAEMKLEGSSNEEISDLLRCSTEETKKNLKTIRRLWRQLLPKAND